MSDHGIDTVRFRFRTSPEEYVRFRRVPHAIGPRGEIATSVNSVRIGAYPDGLLYLEARVAAILDGPNSHRLARPGDVNTAAEQAAAIWRSFGAAVYGDDAAVGRIDLSGELWLDEPSEGQALLHALRAIDLPYLKAGTEGGKRGKLESVFWRSGRSIQYRIYDKGVESRLQEPGRRLRLERQARFRKSREGRVEQVLDQDLASLYAGRYLDRAAGLREPLFVSNTAGADAELRRRASIGAIDGGCAERLAGFLACDGAGLSRATRHRRARELRDLGIAIDAASVEPARVPIGDYVRALVAAWGSEA